MPNPKSYMDEDHVFVPGHVRRKPRRKSRNPYDSIAVLMVIGFLVCVVLWVVTTFWLPIIIAIILLIIIIMVLRWKRWRLRLLNWRIHRAENKNELNDNLREAGKTLKGLKK